jgi:hypothetical protein
VLAHTGLLLSELLMPLLLLILLLLPWLQLRAARFFPTSAAASDAAGNQT